LWKEAKFGSIEVVAVNQEQEDTPEVAKFLSYPGALLD